MILIFLNCMRPPLSVAAQDTIASITEKFGKSCPNSLKSIAQNQTFLLIPPEKLSGEIVH